MTRGSLLPGPGLQLVDRLDQGMFMTGTGNISYQQLYKMVAKALYRTHVEGKLKAEIIQVRAWRCTATYTQPGCAEGRGFPIRWAQPVMF